MSQPKNLSCSPPLTYLNFLLFYGTNLIIYDHKYNKTNFVIFTVAHKGFPEPKPLLEIMLDMKAKYCRYNDPRPDLQQLAKQGLGRNELEDFNKFIRGLKVSYMIPNQPNTRRVWKMNGTRQPCRTQRLVETIKCNRTSIIHHPWDVNKHNKNLL